MLVTEKMNRIIFLILLLSVIAVTISFLRSASRTAAETGVFGDRHTLVLDPGHGGFDGGAVSDDGTRESDLNLSIAQKTRLIAELIGQDTVMTRETDSARTDFASYSEHEDLVHRVKIINEIPGAVLISIHQNDFPTGQPSGAQVLYAAFDGSETFGKLTHANLIGCLDPENRRVAEPAPRSLYITANALCPAILVECGFMSNNFEVLKLCDEAYQRQLALVLAASYLQYLNANEQT